MLISVLMLVLTLTLTLKPSRRRCQLRHARPPDARHLHAGQLLLLLLLLPLSARGCLGWT